MQPFTDSRLVPLWLHPKRDDWLIEADAVLDRIIDKAGKEWTATIDREQALNAFYNLYLGKAPSGLKAVVLNDSHILIYQIGTVWYQPFTPVLIEQFYVRVGHGSGAEALDAIDALAREEGAKGIIMATSLSRDDAALGRLLGRSGYTPMSSHHWKGIN